MYISYVSCLHHSVCHVCFIFRAENCIHVADSCTEKKSTSDTSVEVWIGHIENNFFFCTRAEKLMSAHGVNEAFKVATLFEYFLKYLK